MAAPAYTTDLADIDTCESGGKTWAEPTASGWTLGATPSLDGENYIQGSSSISKAFNATGVGGMMVNNTAGITVPADGAVLGWFYWASPATLESDANGGLRLMMGSSLAAFLSWDVGGKTTYVYGGWINYAINPTVTPDDTVSTGLGNGQYVGAAFYNTNAITKGSPCLVDVFRYGRCEARMVGGETDNYATFAGFASANDATSARWGLISYTNGSYLVKGLVIFGYDGAVDFRDSNKALFVQNTGKVTANFNTFEVRNASSRVDWNSITVTALGTVSPGRWVTTDNAIQNKTDCVFTDLGAFGYASNSTLLRTTYRRCGLVTQNGATFTDCVFENATGAVSVKANNVTLVTGCSFTSNGSNHAVEATTAGDYDWNNELSGYATSDGSGGNEAFYNNSGGHINLTVIGGTRPYVKNGTDATTTVIIPDVTLTISAPVSLVGAEIRIYDMDGTLPNLGTELAGTESHNAATYAFSGSASNVIWVQIMLNGYEEFGQQVTMPTANGNFTALLKQELNA